MTKQLESESNLETWCLAIVGAAMALYTAWTMVQFARMFGRTDAGNGQAGDDDEDGDASESGFEADTSSIGDPSEDEGD